MTPIDILLVEDNPADVRLTLEAFSENGTEHRFHTVSDGQRAVQFLQRTGEYADAVRPDLILLDLNLPRMSGHDVLLEIKADPNLADIPVVVLTTSQAESDIRRSYSLHANCFVTKPADYRSFVEVTEAIQDFWLSVARIPESANSS